MKKKYNSPIIERFAIDKSISLAMQTGLPGDQDGEGWDDWGLPPPGSGGNGISGSKAEKKESTNTFEQNPFK